MNAPQDMLKKATAAMQCAYAPYSHYAVGACLRDESNQLHAGCNVENASFSTTLCAEASALGALISNGTKQVREVLIVVAGNRLCPPCGACRQRLMELAEPNAIVHLCMSDGQYQSITIKELMPFPFGPENLEST